MSRPNPLRFQDIAWPTWQPTETATLIFPRRGPEVLLIHKQRGLGAGKITGPGGRTDPGEALADCAKRELWEEVGLTALDLKAQGDLAFQFTHGLAMHVFLFTTHHFEGEPIATAEADPFWIHEAEVPYPRMWADAPLWLPQVLRGDTVQGKFLFEGDQLLGSEVTVR